MPLNAAPRVRLDRVGKEPTRIHPKGEGTSRPKKFNRVGKQPHQKNVKPDQKRVGPGVPSRS